MTEIEARVAMLERRLSQQQEKLEGLTRTVTAAHRKIGVARGIVETYWNNTPDGSVGLLNGANAWAMHVALVQLAEVLKR